MVRCQWCGVGDVHDGVITKQNLVDLQALVSHPGWQVYVAFARHVASARTQEALTVSPDQREAAVARANAWIERTNAEADLEQAVEEMLRRDAQAERDAPPISFAELSAKTLEA